jgi:2-amino-4-hydroxy-6-hydroxymethyldihydropteridine diphosphokinase
MPTSISQKPGQANVAAVHVHATADNPERVVATAYIGLGSNLGQPRQQIKDALAELGALKNSELLTASSLYCSPPMGPADQPDYINAVARLATTLLPLQLLEALQRIEQAHHRMRKRHWGERTLDLDLLLYDDLEMLVPKLQIPHPGITQRAFVLLPLLEIAPQIVIPEKGLAIKYRQKLKDQEIVKLKDH